MNGIARIPHPNVRLSVPACNQDAQQSNLRGYLHNRLILNELQNHTHLSPFLPLLGMTVVQFFGSGLCSEDHPVFQMGLAEIPVDGNAVSQALAGLGYNSARRTVIEVLESSMDLSAFSRALSAAVVLFILRLPSAPVLHAQVSLHTQAASTPLPSYPVTSVKQDADGDINKPVSTNETGDGLYIRNETLELMIRGAYGVNSYQIVGAPGWVNGREWEVEAKTDDAETQKLKAMNKAEARAERRLLLQSLLAERFKLVVHHETRIEPGFALSVAKGGPKFEEASPSPPGQTPKPPIIMQNGILKFNGLPIGRLAVVLSQVMGRAVADKTGLTGNYEFTIPWTESEFDVTPNTSTNNANGNGDSETSIVTVLRERLGLRLESVKVPTNVIVVDHVEEPSPN
jgi:uncharacterized protein (TIGR03435 family)